MNLLIVSRPNVGTARNLLKNISVKTSENKDLYVPFIKLGDSVLSDGVHNSDQLGDDCFGNTKFKLVKEINNEHGIVIEPKGA